MSSHPKNHSCSHGHGQHGHGSHPHCEGRSRILTRRQMLRECAGGFGALAFGSLLSERALAREALREKAIRGGLHHQAKATSVIFLYMDGGPSQVDSFDPKPRLEREAGQPIGMKIPATQFDNVGKVLPSLWKFKPRGESGTEVSDLFPHVAEHVDKMAVIRSMTSKFSEHPGANYFLHTGHGLLGRPSIGAWLGYGLGHESDNLPGFVVLNGGLIPPGGLETFGNGFLPATFQGSIFRPGERPLANVKPTEASPELQRGKLDLMSQLDGASIERLAHDDEVESAIQNYELAYRMQSAVPELVDLRGESPETRKLYGIDAEFPHTRTFAKQCLVARRLVERGVRFIELTCPNTGHDRWDQHGGLRRGHADNARAVDQPIAGLLQDLEGRGLLESTLVLWGGEFGRTPMAQGTDGRDHNPFGFSMWMAGGGVKGGTVYGATDEYGYYAIENKLEMYDLHATILHLLGIDHERLTVRHGGRDMRLTDVHGHVVHDILA